MRGCAAGKARPAVGLALAHSNRPDVAAVTPTAIVTKLSGETQKIFNDAAFREKFLAPNMIFSIAGTPEDFAQRIKTDDAKWGKVIKAANLRVE